MKTFLIVLLSFFSMIGATQAQNIGGDFTVRGASGCFSTVLDTISDGARDTVMTPLNPHRNSVSFQIEANFVSGNDIDSSVVEVWATRLSGGTSGWVLLNTETLTTSTDAQYFMYDVNGGIGNPYTGYMFVYRTTAVDEVQNDVSWRVHVLIR